MSLTKALLRVGHPRLCTSHLLRGTVGIIQSTPQVWKANPHRLKPRSHGLLIYPRQVRPNSSSTQVKKQSQTSNNEEFNPGESQEPILPSTLKTKQDLAGPFKVWKDSKDSTSYTSRIEVRNSVVNVDDWDLPSIWLRDNCQCSSCVHEDTKQRLLDTFQIPHDIAVQSSEIETDGINIRWSDGHKSHYTKEFLARARSSPTSRSIVRQANTSITPWDSSIGRDPPRIDYREQLQQDNHQNTFMKSILNRIREYGFCYIDNTPTDPKSTEALLESISFIRPTHYGAFYDFTADLASKDTAYTNIALDAHTDTTYFSDPAGLQAFHLLSHTDGEGGASLLVDGFKVAQELHALDREAYDTLAAVNVHSHASGNDGISIQPYKGFPVLQHDPETGHLLQVRWNSSDRAAIGLPINEVERWYDAARKWYQLVKKPENEYWEQLTPGRVLVFDNWRVMHGRSAFTGKRRICGGYINRDDWISKYKMLYYGQKEVLDHLATG